MMKSALFESKPLRREDVHVEPIEDEAVVYDRATNTTYRLNATALRVFQLCDGRSAHSDIARSIMDQYEVGSEQARRDVQGIIAKMSEHGLVMT